uniref:VWA domain-containing protein n=1 Tax=candidate division WOR-3 bacterium TaxID=2052148 RepID=A0A7C6A983_UNCW3
MIGIFVSLILLVLAIFVYYNDLRARQYRWLFCLRILVVLFLGFILIGNIISFTFMRSPKVPLIWLIDVSPSMKDKLSQAKECLLNFAKTKYKAEYLAFADSVFGLAKIENLVIQGSKTDIAKALATAKKRNPGALVLLSDGQHNTLSDPVKVAQTLPFLVYSVGVGETARHDVAIRNLIVRQQVYLGETTECIIRIQSQGLGNKKAKVTLLEQSQELQQKEIILSEPLIEQELIFQIVPNEIGRRFYKIKITEFAEEENLANNQKEFSIQVLKSKMKVIYLSNAPSYNTRFILNALKSEMTEFLPVIAFQGNRFQTPTERGMQDFAFKLDCDVLIVDNLDASQLPVGISNQIQKYVLDGGGVLILAGERFRLNPILALLAPFVHNQKVIRKEVFFKLTEQGIGVPIFFQDGENLLANTPPLLGVMEVKEPQEGTKVWAIADPLNIPLIGYRKFGKGKVIEITGFPLWRFGFYGKDLEKPQEKFKRFLNQVNRFLALKEFEQFTLVTDQAVYSLGEKATFTFYAYQDDGRPYSGLDVNLIIDSTKIPMVEIGDGIYEKTLDALPPKDYIVKAICQFDTIKLGEAKTEFKVTETNIEMIDTRLNAELLRRIAQATGGEYFDLKSFLQDQYEFTLAQYRKTVQFNPRQSPYLYLILVGLFLIELYFRKRRGLM